MMRPMREQLGAGKRFEILKRDSFTCQYCGRKPPVVILHVDHILAVSLGGTNVEDNLVSACQDCNLGKSDKPLERTLAPINFSIQDRKEKLEQLKEYQAFLAEQAAIKEDWIDSICGHWAVRDGQDAMADVWRLPVELEEACRKFVNLLPLQEIVNAVDIAWSRYPTADNNYRFKFFCGVCWKKIRANEQGVQMIGQ